MNRLFHGLAMALQPGWVLSVVMSGLIVPLPAAEQVIEVPNLYNGAL
ncbi:MAG: hypothetical protein HY360_13360, partial [Verrucomicrobia bacterium]|nr:hypothetical protein [Verrucomicrobiota bacterium]